LNTDNFQKLSKFPVDFQDFQDVRDPDLTQQNEATIAAHKHIVNNLMSQQTYT